MYPTIRVNKLHADLTPRAAWQAYRIPDADGFVRLWTVPRTPRTHVNGRWVPDSPLVTAWRPGDRFVVNRYEDADVVGLYIDIVRDVHVTPTQFDYIDQYVDVLSYGGRVWSKDEELLHRLSADEGRDVLRIRDELLGAVRMGAAPFDIDHARWRVPADALTLPPGVELAL